MFNCLVVENTDEVLLRRTAELKTENFKKALKPKKNRRRKILPICTICGVGGHKKKQCVKEKVPNVDGFIPPPDLAHLSILDKVCLNVFHKYALRDADNNYRSVSSLCLFY